MFRHSHVIFSCKWAFNGCTFEFYIKVRLTNRMWFSVVCTLIDNDTRHHSGQNVVDSRGAAEWVRNKFWPLWRRVSLSIRVHTTLNHIRFVFYHNIKDNEGNLSKTRTWKCTRCIMQMSYLYASYFPFKNFSKLAQHTETIRKKCLGNEQWRVLVNDKSLEHD